MELMESERRRLVVDRLQHLNHRSRQAVILRYFCGLPIREVAEALECTEGVARNMLFRSVRKLRAATAAE
jgi:RNA polymerase sigma factor (sigma-70 family)